MRTSEFNKRDSNVKLIFDVAAILARYGSDIGRLFGNKDLMKVNKEHHCTAVGSWESLASACRGRPFKVGSAVAQVDRLLVTTPPHIRQRDCRQVPFSRIDHRAR